jgi:hypothetical protein
MIFQHSIVFAVTQLKFWAIWIQLTYLGLLYLILEPPKRERQKVRTQNRNLTTYGSTVKARKMLGLGHVVQAGDSASVAVCSQANLSQLRVLVSRLVWFWLTFIVPSRGWGVPLAPQERLDGR